MDVPSACPINPAPTGKDRMVALQHLGCTFKEGEHDVTKIATPTVPDEGQEVETIPTFVNATNEESIKDDRSHSKRSF